MQVGDLYQFVLLLVLVGMIVGVGVLTLDKFAATTGITAGAKAAINNASASISAIPVSWMSLIVTIGVLAIILGLVLRSFAIGGGRR